MALQLALSDDFGNDYPVGYRRVMRVAIDEFTQTIEVQTADFRDATARAGGLKPFRVNRGVMITPNTSPSYAQYQAADAADPHGVKASAYALLKMQPENAGAEDV